MSTLPPELTAEQREAATLLPPNASSLENNLTIASARLGNVNLPIDTVWDPDTCPATLLPWLAWAMSVDEWDPLWSEADKRAVIKNSATIHRHKGTIGALKDALSALNMNLDVVEWFQEVPPADAFTFAVNVYLNSRPMDLNEQLNIFKIVAAYKNARSQLSFLHIHQNTQSPVPVIGAGIVTSQHITLMEEI